MGRRTAVIGLISSLFLLVAHPAQAQVNDPFLGRQWNLPAISAPDAWLTGTGAGVTIAVVDTGVDSRHEDLAGKVVGGKNFVDQDKPPLDDNGHGTHVAGIAAAATNNERGIAGVAPDAKIMPIKVLDAKGEGSADAVAQGIRYAADQRAAVINLSLGDNGVGGVPLSAIFGPSFASAIRYAWERGSIPVVSAGNSGDPNSAFITSSSFSREPALVVTSVNRAGTKPNYASRTGSAQWGIAAPGGGGNEDPVDDDIISAWWDADKPSLYAYASGTSMAAPHVSGAAAILRGLGLTPQQTVDKLLNTARDIGPADTFGHGLLDVKAAVAGLAPAGPGSTGTTSKPPASTQPTSGRAAKGSATVTQPRAAGGGAVATPGEPTTVDPSGADDGVVDAGGSGQAGEDEGDGDGDETAAERPLGDDGDRPWPAISVALLTLFVAVSLLAAVARPKPV